MKNVGFAVVCLLLVSFGSAIGQGADDEFERAFTEYEAKAKWLKSTHETFAQEFTYREDRIKGVVDSASPVFDMYYSDMIFEAFHSLWRAETNFFTFFTIFEEEKFLSGGEYDTPTQTGESSAYGLAYNASLAELASENIKAIIDLWKTSEVCSLRNLTTAKILRKAQWKT